jgi:hypothetical protein
MMIEYQMLHRCSPWSWRSWYPLSEGRPLQLIQTSAVSLPAAASSGVASTWCSTEPAIFSYSGLESALQSRPMIGFFLPSAPPRARRLLTKKWNAPNPAKVLSRGGECFLSILSPLLEPFPETLRPRAVPRACRDNSWENMRV